jgi:hypothetical protein
VSALSFSENGEYRVSGVVQQIYVKTNTGDVDGDGVPDFADGFSDLFTDLGSDPNHENPSRGMPESGQFLSLGSVGGDRFKISISGAAVESPPSAMTANTEDGAFGKIGLPSGSVRVWTKNGTTERSAGSITGGGDYVPTGSWLPVSALQGGRLYLEILRPSESLDDYEIEIETDSGKRSTVITAISTEFASVAENGGIERVPAPELSLPSPVVTLSNVSIQSVSPSADGQGLVATIAISGTVESAVCDITPGEKGRITKGYASVNSRPDSNMEFEIGGTKTTSTALRAPFPYQGQFTHTLVDVAVTEGSNILGIMVNDPVYGIPGEAVMSFVVSATAPAGGGTLEESLYVEFPGNENNLEPETIAVTRTHQGVVTRNNLVLNRVTGSNAFASGDGAVWFSVDQVPDFAGSPPTTIAGNYFDQQESSVSIRYNSLAETSPGRRLFGAGNLGSQFSSYDGWDIAIESEGLPESSGKGEFNPMVIQVSGPDELLSTLENVWIGDESFPVVQRSGGYFIGRSDVEDQVATVIMSPIKSEVEVFASPSTSSSSSSYADSDGVAQYDLAMTAAKMDRGEASWKDLRDHLGANARRTAGTMLGDRITPEFYAGLAAGFFGNPKDSAVELWGLAKAAVRYAPKYLEYSPIGLPIKVLWEFTGGDRFETEILVASDIGRQAYGLAEKAGSYWPQVREFLDSMGDGAEAKLQHFLATGEFPGSEKLCPAVKTAIFAAVNLYLMAADWWNELEPYKRGYYQGYVMFEVVLAVVAGVITAPGGGVGAAATLARRVPLLSKLLTHLGPKLRAMNSKLGGQLDPLISKIDEMLSAITGARAGSWCFVAGTMIMTAQGAVPIEQIREGDLVWSAHEETGEAGLRPVIELYRNEAEEIWTVRYAGTEDGAPVRELRCTGEHPFWSETERSFVPASELKPGGELRLFGGEVARVVSVTPHRGPPGVKTRVYNFAVADHHTYFAGQGGVWVHNTCDELLEDIVALNKTHLDDIGDHDAAAKKALEAIKPDTYKGKTVTNPNRMQTGSLLYEQNPNVINAAVSDDIAIANRFLDETNLRVPNPTNSKKPQPVSIARVGDGQQPFIASPAARMPDEWGAELVDELQSIVTQSSNQFGWSYKGLQNAGEVSKHSEGLSLMRMRKELGDLSQFDEIHITTAGRHVCGLCVNAGNDAGLAKIAQALGIKKLIVHADVDPLSGLRFQDLGNRASVVLENGRAILD